MNTQAISKIKSFLKKGICAVLLLFTISFQSFSQHIVQTGMERMELVKINNLYSQIPYLSYRLQYSYADSSSPATVLDSTYVDCWLMSGKSFFSDTETEILNDNFKLLFLDKADSTITVSASQSKAIIQLPLLDSIFNVFHVAGITVTNVNDSSRTLSVSFTAWSNYHGYQVTYNPKNYLIKKIQYYTESNGDFDLPDGHTLSTTINISGYSIAALDPAVFNINRYVYFLNGKYYPQPAYQQYEVTTNQ